MKGDYGSMAWVNDDKGKEYVCTVDVEQSKEKNMRIYLRKSV